MTESERDDSVVPDVEVHHLHSKHVDDEFKILVARSSPADPVPPSHVLLVADANFAFGGAIEMARMFRFGETIPPLLVVGIGYGGAKFLADVRDRRFRDLTPVPSEKYDGKGGGAATFLDFIEDELKPLLAEQYDATSAEYSFFGMSLAGLFATWALLTKPTAFRGYGIGSPSYWWGDQAILATEAEYAASHDDLPARVFVGVGSLETPAGDLRAVKWLPEEKRAEAYEKAESTKVDMVADAALLTNRLERRGYPSLELEYRIFPDEYHLTAGWLNLSWSMRYLFDAPR